MNRKVACWVHTGANIPPMVRFLKHAAACRSTLKIGLQLFEEKISDQHIHPIPEQSCVSLGVYVAVRLMENYNVKSGIR